MLYDYVTMCCASVAVVAVTAGMIVLLVGTYVATAKLIRIIISL